MRLESSTSSLGGEQGVAAHVAQEELQGVARDRGELHVVVVGLLRARATAVVRDLDAAGLDAVGERLCFVLGQAELLDELGKLGQVHAALHVAALDERVDHRRLHDELVPVCRR